MTDTLNLDQVVPLAAQAGLGLPRCLVPLAGGANNRVYRLEAEGGCALVKSYFRHPADPRDRLKAEYSFCTFTWRRGLTVVPRPLASDPSAGLALYEFIPGRRPEPGEVTAAHVQAALDFYIALNRHRLHAEACELPLASEAVFSLAEHSALVQRRLERLQSIVPNTPAEADAVRFVNRYLLPTWERLRNQPACVSFDEPLPELSRGVSPSDFGFHNALLGGGGEVRFVDFEYAGWDDPARTVCDFYCQPAVPAPIHTLDHFAATLATGFPDPERLLERVALLLPVYRIKWCCIVLNDFLPAGNSRRRFSGQGPSEERKSRQLIKAQEMLARAAA